MKKLILPCRTQSALLVAIANRFPVALFAGRNTFIIIMENTHLSKRDGTGENNFTQIFKRIIFKGLNGNSLMIL